MIELIPQRYSLPCLLIILLFWSACNRNSDTPKKQDHGNSSVEITPGDIYRDISFLASDSLKGRETGSAGEAKAAAFIADHFSRYGLQPAGDNDTYFQEFRINMSILNNQHIRTRFPDEERISRNVVGIVPGTGDSGDYVVIGAHYDHLGMGAFGSLDSGRRPEIHNGADDNASGTAGVLELAQYFSNHPPRRSLLFITFSAEEIGLLGSQYFVDHPSVPLDSMMAMINLDMIGRLDNNRLLIFGTSSSADWNYLIEEANKDSLQITTIPEGQENSDHTSFYKNQIPVLHYFTDTHADYHRPTDDIEYINFDGEHRVLEHVKRMISEIDSLSPNELAFSGDSSTQGQGIPFDGITLQVMPDYSFNGNGMRITSVHKKGPAGRAGLKNGDIIIKLDGQKINDIYNYMDVLRTLEKGQTSTVTILRNGKEMSFNIQL